MLENEMIAYYRIKLRDLETKAYFSLTFKVQTGLPEQGQPQVALEVRFSEYVMDPNYNFDNSFDRSNRCVVDFNQGNVALTGTIKVVWTDLSFEKPPHFELDLLAFSKVNVQGSFDMELLENRTVNDVKQLKAKKIAAMQLANEKMQSLDLQLKSKKINITLKTLVEKEILYRGQGISGITAREGVVMTESLCIKDLDLILIPVQSWTDFSLTNGVCKDYLGCKWAETTPLTVPILTNALMEADYLLAPIELTNLPAGQLANSTSEFKKQWAGYYWAGDQMQASRYTIGTADNGVSSRVGKVIYLKCLQALPVYELDWEQLAESTLSGEEKAMNIIAAFGLYCTQEHPSPDPIKDYFQELLNQATAAHVFITTQTDGIGYYIELNYVKLQARQSLEQEMREVGLTVFLNEKKAIYKGIEAKDQNTIYWEYVMSKALMTYPYFELQKAENSEQIATSFIERVVKPANPVQVPISGEVSKSVIAPSSPKNADNEVVVSPKVVDKAAEMTPFQQDLKNAWESTEKSMIMVQTVVQGLQNDFQFAKTSLQTVESTVKELDDKASQAQKQLEAIQSALHLNKPTG
ncbi:MAG: hypothetical protein RLZZ628_2844 [Bacteroidota bacterium]|jgi:hypothetical protein